jgi:hypothetical protein
MNIRTRQAARWMTWENRVLTPISPKKKASFGQVVTTMFFALIAIGRKNTWHKDGATVTFAQVVTGAFVGLAVLVALLAALVYFAMR